MPIIRGKRYKAKRKKGGQRLMELAGTDLASRNAALRKKRARQKATRIAEGMGKAIDKTKPSKVIRHGKTKITVNGKPSPHLTPKVKVPDAKPTTKKPTTKKPTVTKPTTKKPTAPTVTKAQKPTEKPLTMAQKVAKYGGVKARSDLGNVPVLGIPLNKTRLMDKLFPKHRGIGQSQTGYSRAGAGDVGLKVLNAWLGSTGLRAGKGAITGTWKGAPGLWKKMKPWRTGKKPIMSKEFVKTLGGKNLKSFMDFIRRKKPASTSASKPFKGTPKKTTTFSDKPSTPAGFKGGKGGTPKTTTRFGASKPKPTVKKTTAKKPTGKKPTKPRVTKVPRRKSAVKKAPAKKPAVKKAAAKKPATPKQAMQPLIDKVTGLRVGAKKPRVVKVPTRKSAAKKKSPGMPTLKPTKVALRPAPKAPKKVAKKSTKKSTGKKKKK